MTETNGNCLERIVRSPNICHGEPTFRGTRVLLRSVLASLAVGHSSDKIIEALPSLHPDDIKAAIMFAAGSAEEDLPVPAIPLGR